MRSGRGRKVTLHAAPASRSGRAIFDDKLVTRVERRHRNHDHLQPSYGTMTCARLDQDRAPWTQGKRLTVQLDAPFAFEDVVNLCKLLVVMSLAVHRDVHTVKARRTHLRIGECAAREATGTGHGRDLVKIGQGIPLRCRLGRKIHVLHLAIQLNSVLFIAEGPAKRQRAKDGENNEPEAEANTVLVHLHLR